MALHPAIKYELEALQLQFPERSQISLDEYAALYGISRRNAARHLHRRGIIASKEGRMLYISILDLAGYKASCKARGYNYRPLRTGNADKKQLERFTPNRTT